MLGISVIRPTDRERAAARCVDVAPRGKHPLGRNQYPGAHPTGPAQKPDRLILAIIPQCLIKRIGAVMTDDYSKCRRVTACDWEQPCCMQSHSSKATLWGG